MCRERSEDYLYLNRLPAELSNNERAGLLPSGAPADVNSKISDNEHVGDEQEVRVTGA